MIKRMVDGLIILIVFIVLVSIGIAALEPYLPILGITILCLIVLGIALLIGKLAVSRKRPY